MGRPKALKDVTRKSVSSSKAKLHKKFDENETIDEDINEQIQTNSSKGSAFADEDDEPEIISKEESLSMQKLMELHEQTMKKVPSKKQKKVKISKEPKNSDNLLSTIDMSILAEVANRNKPKEDSDEENEVSGELSDVEESAPMYGNQSRKM